jgi:hypothetical protein
MDGFNVLEAAKPAFFPPRRERLYGTRIGSASVQIADICRKEVYKPLRRLNVTGEQRWYGTAPCLDNAWSGAYDVMDHPKPSRFYV